jgi:protein SCO1/2
MFWLATLLVFSGGMLFWRLSKTPDSDATVAQVVTVDEGAAVTNRPKLDSFELIDQTGKRFNSHEFDGQVWAGSFFFTACPSTCYNQNIKLQQLHARYAEQGLRLVSITCDPGNDTPVVLAGYASRFNADASKWKFLTPADGDMQYITQVANDYFQVAVGPNTHTDRVVLFDRRGQILGSYSVLQPDHYRELDAKIQSALSADDEPPSQANEHATAGESTNPADAVGNVEKSPI